MTQSRFRNVVADGELGPVETRPAAEPGFGEALLRVRATSLNYHDWIGVNGGIPGLLVPRVPFSDASAEIVALGSGVKGWSAGERVLPSFYLDWYSGRPTQAARSRVLGDQVDGALQTHVVVPANSLVRTPKHLSDVEAATLGCAGLTAWRSLVVEAGMQPGETVVLQGTGGVSIFALGFAKMLGARVIITSSSDEKLKRARALGADVCINYRENPEWHRNVLDATGGLGADLVVEVGGGATLGNAVQAVRHDGHVSIIGVLTGFAAPDFPLAVAMGRNVTLKGVTVGNTSDFAKMCRAMEQHEMRPVVDSTYTLETVDGALRAMEAQGHFGKIAVTID